MKKSLFLAFIISSVLLSCVPARKYQETLGKQKKCEEDADRLKASNREMETELTEGKALVRNVQKKITQLEADTATSGSVFRMLNNNYGKLNETYELLLQKNKELLAGSAAETTKLSGQLQLSQEELQKKEDALKIMARELELKQKNQELLQGNLEKLNVELQAREKRVNELESILKKQEDAVQELRKKVSAALLGFEGNGLTVEQKNGKVYVSLDEQLLFASGSTKVESKGVEAIKKLAFVLEQNTDINVLIEGHTDDVPMSGAGAIKDNWDLSVIRATSIVKIIAQNSKVDPKRLLAAGRGEYMPVDPAKTPEARKKNRRTEIILSPKLDELLQLLEHN
jgi:chemotaxis protein MotB